MMREHRICNQTLPPQDTNNDTAMLVAPDTRRVSARHKAALSVKENSTEAGNDEKNAGEGDEKDGDQDDASEDDDEEDEDEDEDSDVSSLVSILVSWQHSIHVRVIVVYVQPVGVVHGAFALRRCYVFSVLSCMRACVVVWCYGICSVCWSYGFVL